MMIAAGEQRGAGWRAQRRRMEARVTQTLLGKPVQVWRRYLPPERAPLSEACIVDQYQQDIRRTFWRLGDGDLVGLGVFVSPTDNAFERGGWLRQHIGGLGRRVALVCLRRRRRLLPITRTGEPGSHDDEKRHLVLHGRNLLAAIRSSRSRTLPQLDRAALMRSQRSSPEGGDGIRRGAGSAHP